MFSVDDADYKKDSPCTIREINPKMKNRKEDCTDFNRACVESKVELKVI